MKVLVANLGSTSFKYRLFDMRDEQLLARGGVERIGAAESPCKVQIGTWQHQSVQPVPDHGVAIDACLKQLTDPNHGCIASADEVAAIGFKAVHGGALSGVVRIDESCLQSIESMNSVAPAHNPPYVAAMRQLARAAASIPLVAAFETGFHQTIPASQRHYAIPDAWAQSLPIRRWGFHGASHRYISQRMAQLLGSPNTRIISCHLGGSSSLCAIRDGKSVGTTMGMSPQTGLPQNNRVGDFDPFALPLIMNATGQSLEQVLSDLASRSGLAGMSGTSGDLRDLEAAATTNPKAQLALEVYIDEVRRHLGGLLVALGGADAIVFTGGIGENGVRIRQSICRNLESLGIELDPTRNAQANGQEAIIHADRSRVQLWTVPTNEEIVVARQCVDLLQSNVG
jgi:acetate kinase